MLGDKMRNHNIDNKLDKLKNAYNNLPKIAEPNKINKYIYKKEYNEIRRRKIKIFIKSMGTAATIIMLSLLVFLSFQFSSKDRS